MLNETTHDHVSERIAAKQPPIASGKALSLTCQACGQPVEMGYWQPLARCPSCGTLAYPDRALRNLLPLGWDCPQCGAANDGLANFCLECGAGLASRCLRCEAPVYGAVCLRCGEHQARLQQLHKEQAERADWLPVQRARIREQRDRLQEIQAEASPEPVPATVAVSTSSQTRSTTQQARRRSRRRRGMWPFNWPWMFLVGGLYWLLRSGAFARAGAQAQDTSTSLAQNLSSVPLALQSGWPAFLTTLGPISKLTPGDPQYAALFGLGLIGLIALLFGLYVIDQAVKRLFP